MWFSLVYRFLSLMICLFLIVLIFIISVKWIGIIPEYEVFICLGFFMFFWVISFSGFISWISLLELGLIIGHSIGISHRKVYFSCIFRFLGIHHELILFIFMNVLRFYSFVFYISLTIPSYPKGKCALRS